MGRQTFHDPADALEDARSHRSLGLPSLDTTGQSPTITAGSLTELIRGLHR